MLKIKVEFSEVNKLLFKLTKLISASILVDAIKKKLIVSSVILISPKNVQPKEAEESFSKKKFPPSSIFNSPILFLQLF